MAAEEEVAEHVHHAHEPYDKAVAGAMAIIAALLAIVSVLGQHFTTEKVLNQQLSSDQWAYYQAKDIRRYVAQVAEDDLVELTSFFLRRRRPTSKCPQATAIDTNRKPNRFRKRRAITKER